MASRVVMARPSVAAAFDPLTGIAWHTAVWADDPGWANPGNGGAVTGWDDGTGNGHDLTTTLGSPTFRTTVAALNNHAGVDFDGSDDEMFSAAFTAVHQTFSAVFIGTYDGVGGGSYDRLISLATPNTIFTCLYRASSGYFAAYAGGFGETTVTATTGGHALRGKFTGASSVLNVDGTSAAVSPGGGDATAFGLGGSGSGAVDRANVHVGFAGLYAGDVTAHAGWAGFVSWVSTYYGLTIA